MGTNDIFVSVGGAATDQQERFIRAVEERLRAEGLVPHTLGRNTFSSDAPLKTITELLAKCSGTVVIALERTYFPKGLEKRGGANQSELREVKFATPWNQVEAALAYSRGQPLLVIVEKGVRTEGLLEKGNDWYVQSVVPEPASLSTAEFNGILSSWRAKVSLFGNADSSASSVRAEDLTVAQLLRGLKPSSLWRIGAAIGTLLMLAFGLGVYLTNLSASSPKAASAPDSAVAAEIVKTICTGEIEANCPGPHDMFYTCASPFTQDIATQICSDLKKPAARTLTTHNAKGNQCGYSLIKLTCS